MLGKNLVNHKDDMWQGDTMVSYYDIELFKCFLTDQGPH